MSASGAQGPVGLSQDEILRYARHLITPEVGMEGQLKLKQASVLCVGTGGLGSPITIYLAAAGIGKLGLVDSDVVDVSNLQRQVLHGTRDVGRPKLDSARDTLRELNPFVEVATYDARFSRQNALAIARDYDIVVDGTDNIPSRYLLSDVCVLLGKPLVHGSVYRFEGQVTVFDAKQGPCYRCVYPDPPPPELVQRIAVGGILGVQPGIIGCIQALEVIKRVVGKGKPLIGRLLTLDSMNLRFREVKIQKNPQCVACGPHASLSEQLFDYEEFCGLRGAGPAAGPGGSEITVPELQTLIDAGRPFILIDLRAPKRSEAERIPGARPIPLPEVLFHLHEFTWADTLILYGESDEEAEEAAKTFRQANFRKTRVLKGGIAAWREEAQAA